MNWNSRLFWLVLSVACCHLGVSSAADQTAIVDVALTPERLLCGQLVTADGVPQAEKPLSVLSAFRGRNAIDQTTTNDQGVFAVRIDKSGLYLLTDGTASALVRVWTNGAAPPSAIRRILMVSDENTVRANLPRHRRAEAVILAVAGVAVIYEVVDSFDAS